MPSSLPNAILGESEDASVHPLPCTAPVASARPHEAGNYDNRSCNSPDCHDSMIGGGWAYAIPNGPPWVAGATITITNIDGTTIKAYSGKDGFFQIKEKVKAPYKVCASKCPDTSCSLLPHVGELCQTSNCHGTSDQRIYVSQNLGAVRGIDSSDSTRDAGNCEPPSYGGPYTHSEYSFGQQSCTVGGCHGPPKPIFEGGFLYDAPAGTKTVAEATITIIPASGAPIEVVTGPDGMFFFGTVSAVSVARQLPLPYTACVSKCPQSVCSTTNGHTTADNCQSSQCHVSPFISSTAVGNVYLR